MSPSKRVSLWPSLLLAGAVMVLLAPVRAALAATERSTSNDRILYRGIVYEAVRNGDCSMAVRWYTKDGAQRGTIQLGGCTNYRPTLATDRDQRFMVFYHRGTDNALYSKWSTDGNAWNGWNGLGGVLGDAPQAYGVNDVVAVSVTGSDGYTKYMQYTTSTNGSTHSGWLAANGKEIPLGSAFMSKTYPYDTALAELRYPEVVRARMFHGLGNNTPILSAAMLDQMVLRGVRTMIITTRDEIKDVADFNTQIFGIDIGGKTVAGWCAAQTKAKCIIELGNEPDRVQHYYASYPNGTYTADYFDPWKTRWRALDILNDFDTYRRASNQNMQLMISLPTLRDNARFAAEQYFNIFTESFSHTAFGTTRVGDAFDAVAAHTYSFSCIANVLADGSMPGNPEGVGTPMRPIFRAIDTSRAGAGVYVTEFNINSTGWNVTEYDRWNIIGKRLVTALDAFNLRDGRVRGVTAFHSDYNPDFAPGATGPYNIDQNAGDWIGHRHMGLGNRGEECAIRQSAKNTRY